MNWYSVEKRVVHLCTVCKWSQNVFHSKKFNRKMCHDCFYEYAAIFLNIHPDPLDMSEFEQPNAPE